MTRTQSRPLGPGTLAALALVGIFAVLWVRPPAPEPVDAPLEAFSAERAWPDLERIAAEPRFLANPSHERVRALLSRRLEELGFEVLLQARPFLTTVREVEGEEVEETISLTNVVGRLRGTGDGDAVLLDVHYDSVLEANGAGDNGAAMAAALEALRAWKASLGGKAPRNDVIMLFTDGEELGLHGAELFCEVAPEFEDVRVVLNFDARGVGGPSNLFQTGSESGGLVRAYARGAPHAFGTSLGPAVFDLLPNDTDFSVFLRRGVNGLNFAFIGGGQAYHTPRDRIENLSPGSLQHHGEAMLALLKELANADLDSTLQEAPVEFLTVPGVGLVWMPAGIARAVGILVAAAALVLVGACLRRGQIQQQELARGGRTVLVGIFGTLFVAVLLAEATRLGVGGILRASGRYDDVARGSGYLAGEVGTLGLWWVMLGSVVAFHPRGERAEGSAGLPPTLAGALLLGAILAIWLPFWARGASHITWIPLAGVVLAAAGPGRCVLRVLGALPGLMVLLPIAALFTQVGSIRPTMEAILGGFGLAMVLGSLAPVLEALSRGTRRGHGVLWMGVGTATLALRAALEFFGR